MTAAEFVIALFGATSAEPVYLCSLPNIRNDPAEPGERRVTTRDATTVQAFLVKWDRPGRGMFYCMCTVEGPTRNKAAVVTCVGLWLDLDFAKIDADEPTIRQALREARCPPTGLVRSGNGLHGYWLFKEGLPVQENAERIESALRQLADLFAGDLAVCEVSRLMRLPGSHNSKGYTPETPVWTEVVVEFIDGPRYELDDLEEWLSETAPVCQRKAAVEKAAAAQRSPGVGRSFETNHYLEYAKSTGWSPPLDVEQALNDMAFGNIHQTQLSVTASLLNAGRDIEWVVDTVLDATASAAGDLGTRWNWTRERKALRRMCETWLSKHPQQVKSEARPELASSGQAGQATDEIKNVAAPRQGAVVVNLDKARQATKRKPKPIGNAAHIVLAGALLAVMEGRGETLLFTGDGAYHYSDNLCRYEPDAAMRLLLDTSLETAARELAMETTNRLISEARNYIMRHPDLYRKQIPWDAHGQVPTRSGLVNPHTGAVTPPQPEHYATWRIEAEYDPTATCPLWLQMLDDVFADLSEASRFLHIQLLQELLGAGLIDEKPKALSMALIVEGGSNTGKSELLSTMSGLFGDKCNATPFEMLSTAHGLMPFASRVPWVLHEAFDQAKWHMSSMVKAIISGDAIQINIKNGPQVTRTFTAPIFLGTNHPAQFKEATAAITNRLVVLKCGREFDAARRVGVAEIAHQRGYSRLHELVLAAEMPGLLAWAVVGLGRALVRGKFVLPAEAAAAAADIRRDSNLAQGFIQECCEYTPDGRIRVADLAVAHTSWWLENKGDDVRHVPSSDAISRAIKALNDRRVGFERDMHRRYYIGLRLNAEGMRHWHNAVASEAYAFAGRKASTSNVGDNPNDAIPASWLSRPGVSLMQLSHRSVSDAAASGNTSSEKDEQPDEC